MSRMIDLTGKRFFNFTVTSLTEERNSRDELRWICRCDCGNEFKTTGRNIRHGSTKSCGCYGRSISTKHGLWSKHKNEYRIWQDIISRCRPSYEGGDKNYGDRGISVCKRWTEGEGDLHPFACFMEDMGPRPSKDHSVDRMDNDGNYETSNCQWRTWKDQCRNKRNNVYVKYMGVDMTMAEAIEKSGTNMNSGTFWFRIKNGMTPEEAFAKPVRGST